MCGDIEMNKAAAVVLDDYEYIQEAKPRGDGNEEVTGYESPRMQAQEGRPAQVASRPSSGTPRQVFPHCPGRDPNSELQKQLVSNALLSPRRIFARDSVNQGLNRRRNRRPAGPGFQAPEQSPPHPVPADHRFGAHHDQRRAPIEQAGQQHQAHPRCRIDPARLHAPLHIQRELPPQEQNLCLERSALTNLKPDPADQVRQ